MSSSPVDVPVGTQAARATPARPPLRIFLTILNLAALGVFGWAVVTVFFTLLGVGIGTALIAGVGLVLLVGLVYMMFGVAWFENERVSGLYALDLPRLRLVPRQGPGFGGYLRALGKQSINGRMWQSLASFGIASALGTAFLGCVQTVVWAVLSWVAGARNVNGGAVNGGAVDRGFGSDFGSLFGVDSFAEIGATSAVLYVIALCIAIAGIIGIPLLHHLIAVGIARSSARTAQLTEEAAVSAKQREGAVRAADVERTRIERDLHDGVQPRLVSVGMTLGLAQQQIDSDPDAAKALIAEAHTSTKSAITELRQLARGIHPSVLDDRGLDAALSAIASRSHIPVVLDVRIEGRCSREAETAVYFAIAESLTNAAKHSRASECRVVVRVRDGSVLWARVEDNGIGGARVLPGGGLDGITNRIQAAGGTVRLDSPQGGPTSLEVSVPCAS